MPDMTFSKVLLSDVAMINPRRSPVDREDETETSFVPMEAVDDITGRVLRKVARSYGEVKKGYTMFQERDVIFAKISPCMQNGKHAVVSNLIDGIGFGSTEFHVIRAGGDILPEWIHYFLRSKEVAKAAERTFTGAVGQQRVPSAFLQTLEIPLPPLAEQKRIVDQLKAQLAEVEKVRQALEFQELELVALANATITDSFNHGGNHSVLLRDVLEEVKKGVGENWKEYPVLGATRAGLALAKEPPGKRPERYKPVTPGTVFYNPMRINIGSIALVDDGDEAGITSPDYVALRGRKGIVNSRWFYYWLRSRFGEQCIASLARGAVRERMLFNRLAEAVVDIPPFTEQNKAASILKEIVPLKGKVKLQKQDVEILPSKLLEAAFSG